MCVYICVCIYVFVRMSEERGTLTGPRECRRVVVLCLFLLLGRLALLRYELGARLLEALREQKQIDTDTSMRG